MSIINFSQILYFLVPLHHSIPHLHPACHSPYCICTLYHGIFHYYHNCSYYRTVQVQVQAQTPSSKLSFSLLSLFMPLTAILIPTYKKKRIAKNGKGSFDIWFDHLTDEEDFILDTMLGYDQKKKKQGTDALHLPFPTQFYLFFFSFSPKQS